MASEKKPSIYYDRGTIGSSAELDEYGVWVKSEPQDITALEMEPSPEEDTLAFSSLDDMFEDDLSPEVESTVEDDDGFKEVSLEDFLGDMGFNTDTPLSDDSDDSPETPGEEGSGEDSAEDIAIDDINLDDFPVEKTEQEVLPANQELSTQLLMKIAEELSAIRDEISSLKQEFAGIKIQPQEGEEKSAEKAGHGFFDEADDEQIALTGDELNNIINTADFVEESGGAGIKEADETTSLPFPETAAESSETDESLDLSHLADPIKNDSLNDFSLDALDSGDFSAEIPDDSGAGDFSLEESPGDVQEDFSLEESLEEPSGDFSLEESPGEAEDIFSEEISLPEDLSLPEELVSEPVIDETALNPLPDMEDSLGEELPLLDDLSGEITLEEREPENQEESSELDISLDETDDLWQLQENGVEPMTAAPEADDVSFLEEDPLAVEQFDGTLDLSDAVIDEPDLSPGIQENPLEEPSPEDLSLDLEEDLSLLEPSEELDVSIPEEEVLEIPEENEEISLDSFIAQGGVSEPAESGENLGLLPGIFEAEDEELSPLTPDEEAEVAEELLPGEEEESPEGKSEAAAIPAHLKQELKSVLSYMDKLLESLPDEKIEEFARSEYYDTYKKLFKELGLV